MIDFYKTIGWYKKQEFTIHDRMVLNMSERTRVDFPTMEI